MNNEVILRVADACTAWNILPVTKLAKLGLDEDFYRKLVDILESNPSKIEETIFVDGKVIGACEAVRGWELLWELAVSVRANTSIAVRKSDRAPQADELKAAIRKRLFRGTKVLENSSRIEVLVLDLTALSEEVLSMFRDKGWVESPDATLVAETGRWGYIESREGPFALTSHLPDPHRATTRAITEKKKLPLHFNLRYKKSGGGYRNDIAEYWYYKVELGPESLRALPVRERVALASVIDSGHSRGRRNLRAIRWQKRVGRLAISWVE